MKIVTKDNFCLDLFVEMIIAENVTEYIGREMVYLWNSKNWNENSDYYLALVDDDYVPYDGYKINGYY